MESIKEILSAWMDEREKVLIEQYHKKNIRASGRFERELTKQIDERRATLSGNRYIGVAVGGRKPNTKQDIESLRKWVGWAGSTFLKDWVSDKGIGLNSFAVAWGIARTGVTVPNAQGNDGRLINDTLTHESVRDLVLKLGRFEVATIKSEIQKSWRQ
jgi:hypothetical protein